LDEHQPGIALYRPTLRLFYERRGASAWNFYAVVGEAVAMHYYETLARRIVAEVDHLTAERPMRWVTLQQVARRLKVHYSSAAAAVRVAVDGGWLIAEGSPPHSVCRTEAGRTSPQSR
jgi:hypothetical protein